LFPKTAAFKNSFHSVQTDPALAKCLSSQEEKEKEKKHQHSVRYRVSDKNTPL
jgi:hypothetical protein